MGSAEASARPADPLGGGRARGTGHALWPHLLAAAALAALAYLAYDARTAEFASSDGSNYASVARNVVEGHGLVSSVIGPGLMTLVPTTRTGQAFVTQQPLWPLALAGWFSLFGAGLGAAKALAVVCAVVAAVECWALGYLFSSRVTGGYLALALSLLSLHLAASTFALYNIPLQAALLAALFLLMFARPRPAVLLLAAAVFGLGLVARETSAFVAPGLLWAWRGDAVACYRRVRAHADRRWLLACLPVALGVVALAAGPWYLEGLRRSHLLAGRPVSTLRATFLYLTPVFDQGWPFLYDYKGFDIDPLRYFLENPNQLVRKIWLSLRVGFLHDTLPALLAPQPWFVPMIAPWLLPSPQARRVAHALLLSLAAMVLASSITYMHPHYFVAYLPILYALIAATVLACGRAALSRMTPAGPGKRLLSGAVVVYAVLPMLLTLAYLLRGHRLPTGENPITKEQREKLVQFVVDNTEPDSVITCGYTALMAWHTRRTMMIYSGHPLARVSNREMWHRIDAQVRIDHIVLTSLSGEDGSMEVLEGFKLRKTLADGDLKAWLFSR